MSDIVERLRASQPFNIRGPNYETYMIPPRPIQVEAADEIDRLREALRGLLGLVLLVGSRDDCPIQIKQPLTDHWRLDDARAALAEEAGK